jgi:hypothetical protein
MNFPLCLCAFVPLCLWRGKVTGLGWTVQSNAIRSLDPTAAEDLRVVTAHVHLDGRDVEKHKELLERLINLQADVRITAE